jgi:pilus assembly protein CpaB
MNIKTLIPLVVAIALGAVAAKMGKDMMGKGHGDAGPGVKLTKVVVAKEDLAPGATIKDTDVALKDFPADARSEQGFATVGELVGRVVTTQIVKNQPVLNTLLAPSGTAGGLTAMVPPGMRAVTLEINEVSGLGGLLAPGARVDLVQTIETKTGEQGKMAKTIVENILVLAVGRRTSTVSTAPANGNEPEPMAHSVTLLATAEQTEAIDLASHVGSPRLVLRNGTDKESSNSKGVTVAQLRGDDDAGKTGVEPATKPTEIAKDPVKTEPTKPEPVAVEPPRAPTFREVEVIRAGASTSVRVNLKSDGSAPFTTAPDKKLFGDD